MFIGSQNFFFGEYLFLCNGILSNEAQVILSVCPYCLMTFFCFLREHLFGAYNTKKLNCDDKIMSTSYYFKVYNIFHLM